MQDEKKKAAASTILAPIPTSGATGGPASRAGR